MFTVVSYNMSYLNLNPDLPKELTKYLGSFEITSNVRLVDGYMNGQLKFDMGGNITYFSVYIPVAHAERFIKPRAIHIYEYLHSEHSSLYLEVQVIERTTQGYQIKKLIHFGQGEDVPAGNIGFSDVMWIKMRACLMDIFTIIARQRKDNSILTKLINWLDS